MVTNEKMENMLKTLKIWSEGGSISGISAPSRLALFTSLEFGMHTLWHFGKYRTICLDEIEYWKFFGFDVTKEGVGWVVS